MDIGILIILIIFSGMFSGLTIGLSKLSKQETKRLSDLGDKKATKILSVLEDGNLLLVTLLLGNTLVNSSLSVFLGSVVGTGTMAVLVSTSLIFIFGEMSPAAILTKYALEVGSRVTPLIKFITFLFYPIAKPIAFILDKTLGKEMDTYFNRNELKHIIDSHEHSIDSDLDEQDSRIIRGVLSLSEKTAEQHMTPKNKIFSLYFNRFIDDKLLDEIRKNGHTRIPVLKDNMVIGILNSKNLIGLDKELENTKKVIDVMKSNKFIIVKHNDKIDDILQTMINRNIHIANVLDDNKWVGIITMEDILEEIFQKEIIDETDKIVKIND